jgi:hypothetical protein
MVHLTLADQSVGSYVHWGVIQISVTNLVIILVMLLVFVLALLLPFPGGRDVTQQERRP